MRVIEAIRHGWAQHRAFKAALAELGAYSDSDLTDLGIGRADVARVAWDEAERRMAVKPIGKLSRRPHAGLGFSFAGAR